MNEARLNLYANDLLRENTRLKAQLAQLTPILYAVTAEAEVTRKRREWELCELCLLRENTRLKAQLAQEAGDDIPIEDIEESIRAAIADAENEEARYAN